MLTVASALNCLVLLKLTVHTGKLHWVLCSLGMVLVQVLCVELTHVLNRRSRQSSRQQIAFYSIFSHQNKINMVAFLNFLKREGCQSSKK